MGVNSAGSLKTPMDLKTELAEQYFLLQQVGSLGTMKFPQEQPRSNHTPGILATNP